MRLVDVPGRSRAYLPEDCSGRDPHGLVDHQAVNCNRAGNAGQNAACLCDGLGGGRKIRGDWVDLLRVDGKLAAKAKVRCVARSVRGEAAVVKTGGQLVQRRNDACEPQCRGEFAAGQAARHAYWLSRDQRSSRSSRTAGGRPDRSQRCFGIDKHARLRSAPEGQSGAAAERLEGNAFFRFGNDDACETRPHCRGHVSLLPRRTDGVDAHEDRTNARSSDAVPGLSHGRRQHPPGRV